MNCTVWYCPRCERNNHITEDFCPTCGIKYDELDKTIDKNILIKRRGLIDRIKELEIDNWNLERQIKQNERSVESLKQELSEVKMHG